MHFSTSDENFRKKLPYGCKVKVPQLNAVEIQFVMQLKRQSVRRGLAE